MTARPRRADAERSPWSRRLLIGLGVVLLPELAANVFANAFAGTGLGHWLQVHVAAAVAAVVVLVLGLLLVVFAVERRRPPPVEPEPPPPREVEPEPVPEWRTFPDKLRGREQELDRAQKQVRSKRRVAIVGPRDIGTSAVASWVVDKVRADLSADREAVVWVDLRGRSSTEPPTPRAVASRLLARFRLDEPADDSGQPLGDAARRLVAAARQRPTVLLLDNVFTADQVSWLADVWPRSPESPLLVIAGDEAVAPADAESAVSIGPLTLVAMREILRDELGESRPRKLLNLFRDRHGEPLTSVDALLGVFKGRPRAAREIATMARALDQKALSLSALEDALHDQDDEYRPLVELWKVALRNVVGKLSAGVVDVPRALAVLPVTGVSRAALAAMAAAIPLPGDPVTELCRASILKESPPGRFRLPEEVRLAVEHHYGAERPPNVWQAAAALVHHYADLAADHATALGTATNGGSAAVWLHQEEPLLGALVSDWRPAARPPATMLDDLARIADALDVWYVRESRSDGLLKTGRALETLAGEAKRPDLVWLARLRIAAAHRIAGRLDEAKEALTRDSPGDGADRHGAGSALRARWHHCWALIEFDHATAIRDDRPAANDRLQAAESDLWRAMAALPTDDVPGRVCVLINLAAVCVERDRLPAAVEHLDHAKVLAEGGGDLSGAAQVVELQGVVAARGHNYPHAAELWQQAMAAYGKLGEEQGEARCRQHLAPLAGPQPPAPGAVGAPRPNGSARTAGSGPAHPQRDGQPGADRPKRTPADGCPGEVDEGARGNGSGGDGSGGGRAGTP